MHGTILIVDGVSTNRIMLRAQLSSAWYRVVQAEELEGLQQLVLRTRPDLIVTAMTLQDGTALDLHRLLGTNKALRAIPIIAITPQNDRAARLRALEAGIDDVLSQPLNDVLLQARIRSLLRGHSAADDLQQPGLPGSEAGLAEGAAGFSELSALARPTQNARVALITGTAETGLTWRHRLRDTSTCQSDIYRTNDVQNLLAQPIPDAIVVDLSEVGDGAELRLLADLRARLATRHSAIIAVPPPGNALIAAEALDRGAHDALADGFCPEELSLRLNSQLRRKARSDRLRDGLRYSLHAAMHDPMTGLYNRRFALPKLAEIARDAAQNGRSFAVMLADLDHFKSVNDRFGHLAGDAVLEETARRLCAATRAQDMIARIGGEEFMIVQPDVNHATAKTTADRLCREINATPYNVPGVAEPLRVTTSIGVVVSVPPAAIAAPFGGDQLTNTLINQADQALYQAKDSGRNQFTLIRPAA